MQEQTRRAALIGKSDRESASQNPHQDQDQAQAGQPPQPAARVSTNPGQGPAPEAAAPCICGRLTSHRYGLRMPARLAQELRDYVVQEYRYLPEKWQSRIISDLCLHKVLEYAAIAFTACCPECAERIHQRDYPQLDGEPWCIL
ncbi:hypothetical protein [Thermogemmatispora sp.]|uniref:hypothetical protein n=1 Tax=Thermogemmatispora sp. TaxID=1968838 RepID=UPI001E05531B|nr:hypothetical protein [Thermogemmatispora sp.]MBX5450892.1 hypothetical protein [Thermogemmatispora sp.]